jgi:hypothetical protein
MRGRHRKSFSQFTGITGEFYRRLAGTPSVSADVGGGIAVKIDGSRKLDALE